MKLYSKNGSNMDTTDKNKITLIGGSSNIKGILESEDDIRIDGVVEGDVNTEGKLVVGNKGKIIGNIKTANIEIFGEIIGDVLTKNELAIRSEGKVEGNISCLHLIVENGATFNGECKSGVHNVAPKIDKVANSNGHSLAGKKTAKKEKIEL